MPDIKFAKDYGYSPPTPFWLVWNEDARSPTVKHATREIAETEAARLASENMGRTFHVLAAMSAISTTAEVVGARFDPARSVVTVADEVAAPPPAFIADSEVAF